MRIKTCTLVAAVVVGTLGFASNANAQSAYGTAYGRPGAAGPQVFPATPPLYSANYSAPTPGLNLATRGYSQYTAGYYYPNPYTAGVPRNTLNSFNSFNNLNNFNSFNRVTPSMQLGTINGFRTTNVYGLGSSARGTIIAPRRLR